MEIFLKGLIAGFIIAVPLGPVSVLCFRRVLTERLSFSLFTVFGAAAADTIYGLIAALGISAVTRLIQEYRQELRIFGGLFLLYLGYRMVKAHPVEKNEEEKSGRTLPAAFFSAFGMMIANPVIVFSFLGVFAGLDLAAHHAGLLEATWLGAGLFAGSSAWWLVYKLAARLLGPKLGQSGLHSINLGAGLLICAFGVWELGVAILRHH